NAVSCDDIRAANSRLDDDDGTRSMTRKKAGNGNKKSSAKASARKRSTVAVRRSTASPLRGPTRTAIRNFTLAAGRGDLAAVQAVLAKLPQLAREPDALLEAACNGHADVVRCLLDGGADANAVSPDEKRCRPLHRVIETTGHPEVIKVLLEHGGADACA